MQKGPVTAGDIAAITEGKLSGAPDTIVTDVTHDSRQARQGTLFAAVRGELFDAHKFILPVMGQGAIGVISELERPSVFSGAWILVEDICRVITLSSDEVHNHASCVQ